LFTSHFNYEKKEDLQEQPIQELSCLSRDT
jgi:hypothetical protein